MFEAYSVGIRLRLLDSVSTGLISLAGQFAGLNRHVSASQAQLTQLENKLKQIKMLGLFGGVATAVGAGGLALFKAPIDEAKKFQTEVARFGSLGFGAKVNADAETFARGMQTYGTSARDNMMLLSDSMAVFKRLEDAEVAAPILAKMKFANEALFGERAGDTETKFMDMLKVIELRRGLSSQAEFATQANFVQQVIAGSRNRVDATQLLQALKTGGVAVSQLSNESFYLGLEPLIQEFGGQRLGTGLMSMYQNLVQSRGTVTAQQELYRLGLLDPSRVQFNQLGMLKKALPGAFRGSEVLEKEGPLALLEKVLLPAFARKGITDEEGILREIGMILGNRTGSSVLSRAYQQRATIERQVAANRSAENIDQLTARAQTTLGGKELQLEKQWANTKLAFGEAVLPIAIKLVDGLTKIVQGVVAFAHEYPAITRALTVGFGVLAALVAAGGAVTLATAGFKALGLALAIGRLGGLVSIGGALSGIARGIVPAIAGLTTFTGVLGGLVGLLTSAGAGYLFGKLINSLGPQGDLGGWIGGKLHSAFNNDAAAVGQSVFHTGRPKAGADFNADMRARGDSPFIKNGAGTPVTVKSDVYLDLQKVGSGVTKFQVGQVGRPQTGPSFFDGSMALPPAGGGF